MSLPGAAIDLAYRPVVRDVVTIARILLDLQEVRATWVLSSLLLVPAATVLARRSGWSWWRVAAAALSCVGIGLVLGVTLGRSPGGLLVRWGRGCLVQPGLSLRSGEEVLNFLLFAPACFFAVLALRRYLPVLALALLGSGLIEAVQSLTGVGTCQTSDVVRNVSGGALAGLVALGFLAVVRRPSRVSDSEGELRVP